MMKYKCQMCGHIYDDSKEKVKFVDLPEDWVCPACGAPKSLFDLVEEPTTANDGEAGATTASSDEVAFDYIRHLASTGKSLISAGPTTKKLPKWDDILLMSAQLARVPLHDGDVVNTTTIIGKKAKKPLEIAMPVIVSHMSFGALNRDSKVALAEGAAKVGTANSSGEGGILEDEISAAHRYIFEYVPNLYSVTDENLKRADAIEVKIGQSAKPGMGGHLPAAKVTEEIAQMRGKKVGEDIISPSHFERLKTKEDLKELVEELRKKSDGRPIGVKIAANNIEDDLEFIGYAGADFVTIDGRGGSTGAAPVSLKDAAGVPTIYALYRAKKYIDEHKLDLDLIVTGGFRVPSDIAKAIAMGADAVAVATAALTAMGADADIPAAEKVANFLDGTNEELKMFARVTGYQNVHDISAEDLATTDLGIAKYTSIRHV